MLGGLLFLLVTCKMLIILFLSKEAGGRFIPYLVKRLETHQNGPVFPTIYLIFG